jgi:hypothetical protein
VLNVNIIAGRQFRETSSWFNVVDNNKVGDSNPPSTVGLIAYDEKVAMEAKLAAVKLRQSWGSWKKSELTGDVIHEEVSSSRNHMDDLLSIETNLSEEDSIALSPLRRLTSATRAKHGKNRALDCGNSITSSMLSISKQETIQYVADIAARKLHNDGLLQKAERLRTKRLSELHTKRNSDKTVAIVPNTKVKSNVRSKVRPTSQYQSNVDTMLMKKSNPYRSRRKKRDIWKDQETMQWLCYHPKVASLVQEQEHQISVRNSVFQTAPNPPQTVQSDLGIAALNNSSTSNPDLWDYLLDNVIDIVSTRPKVVIDENSLNATTESMHQDQQSRSTTAISSIAKMKYQAFMSLTDKKVIRKDSWLFQNYNKNNETSIIPKTSKVKVIKPIRGRIPTPRIQRKAIDAASISSDHESKANPTQSLQTKEESSKLTNIGLLEVYRRILSIPTTTVEELSGERVLTNSTISLSSSTTSYIASLFQKLDTNDNGYISQDEFKFALYELNLEISNEECEIFFHRFGYVHPRAERENKNIDYPAFLQFVEYYIAVDVSSSWSSQQSFLSSGSSSCNLIELLLCMHDILHRTLQDMQRYNLTSIERLLERTACSEITTGEVLNLTTMPDNILFASLDLKELPSNVKVLHALGLITIGNQDMARISRVFDYQLSSFMEFIRSPGVDLSESVNAIDVKLCNELRARFGGSSRKGIVTEISDSHDNDNELLETVPSLTPKIWTALAASTQSLVGFERLVQYFQEVMRDPQTTILETTPPDRSNSLRLSPAMKVDVLIRILVDALLHSAWNKCLPRPVKTITPIDEVKQSRASSGAYSIPAWLSFSGLDAYLRRNRIQTIERKLKYLLQLESNKCSTVRHLLVHVYLTSTSQDSLPSQKGDEMLIVASDPLSGEVYTLSLKDSSFAALPRGKRFKESLNALYNWKEVSDNVIKTLSNHRSAAGGTLFITPDLYFDQDVLYLYNAFDSPIEDSVITGLLFRLRLVRNRLTDVSELILAEDPKLIKRLNSVFDHVAVHLPFFSLVNEYSLSFDVDDQLLCKSKNTTRKHGSHGHEQRISIRNLVFDCLRKHKGLSAFVTSIRRSSLRVILSTYNNSLKEILTWDEMLAHLTNHCNPFVTIQLLPTYISPKKYFYKPVEVTGAFTGEDESNDAEQDDSESERDEDDRQQPDLGKDLLPPLPKYPNWQCGSIDFDGSPNPSWNESFQFNFQSPKLTTCQILSTEIVKMRIHECWKYLIVMIREGLLKKKVVSSLSSSSSTQNSKSMRIIREPFRFLTLYDPKTASEYQCGVQQDTQLYRYLRTLPMSMKDIVKEQPEVAPQQGSSMFSSLEEYQFPYDIKELMQALHDAAENHQLILGPAITPRLEIQVFNHQDGKVKELLGTAQVSISSVLSGSGISEKTWITLTYPIEKSVTENAFLSMKAHNKLDEIPKQSRKLIDVYAGQIQVELSFRRLIEIEAERQAWLKRMLKKAQQQDNEGSSPLNSTRQHSPRDMTVTGVIDVSMDDDGVSNTISENESQYQTTIKELFEENINLQASCQRLKVELQNKIEVDDATTTKALPSTEDLNREIMEQLHKDQELLMIMIDDLKKEQALILKEKQTLEEEMSISLKRKQSENDEEVFRWKEELERLQAVYEKTIQGNSIQLPRQKSMNHADQPSSLSTNLIAMPCETSTDLSGFIRHLLTIFQERYNQRQKKHNTTLLNDKPLPNNVLDGFFRLLQSYRNAEGQVSCKDIVLVCQEVLIDLSIEQAHRILQEVDPHSKTKWIAVSRLKDYLFCEYNDMMRDRQHKMQLDQRISSSSTMVRSHSKSDKFGSKSNALLSNAIQVPTATFTREIEETSINEVAPDISVQPKRDWDSEPLPQNWDRKYSEKHKRVSFCLFRPINHQFCHSHLLLLIISLYI